MRPLTLALATVLISACGPAAPAMPPQDSMTVDMSAFNTQGQLNERTHWGTAAVRVAFLNTAVFLRLAAPVGVFATARSKRVRWDGDAWVWQYSQKDLLVDATAKLTARLDGAASVWEMRIDGRVGNQELADFLWYEGRYEVSSGFWQFYEQTAERTGKTIKIDWSVGGPTDKELKFTDDSGTQTDGNTLTYRRDGDAASVTYDFKTDKKADIVWSASTIAGSITAADYPEHVNVKACWDKDRYDVDCP